MADLSERNSLNLVSGDDEGPDWYTALHTNFETIDAAIALCDDALAADPVAGDDELDGFATRSIVITVAGKIFLCTDPTTGAAVWRQIWPAKVGDMDMSLYVLKTLAADWDAGSYKIKALQLESDITAGTAPLIVASDTVVTNLNASKLEGNAASAFAVAANGVTNGDSHDHTGGDGAAIPSTSTAFAAASKILGRKTAGAGAGEECSLSDVLDFIGSAARGDILVRGASGWARLAVGADQQYITTDGVDLSWAAGPGLTGIAAFPSHYERSRMWKHKGSSAAADRRTLVTPDYLTVNINNSGYILEAEIELDLNDSDSWDTTDPTDYTVAATRAGKQFYVYACVPEAGIEPVILISAATTFPAGYDADTSRKIGSFHCLCVAAGTITSHPLTGYLAGDILPRSIQDLKHRPNGRFIPGIVWAGVCDYLSDVYAEVWAFIYLASGTGASTVSAYGGTISDTRDWMDFVDDFNAIGCRLPKDFEFQAIAFGSNEETNISTSADPVTTGGHSDTAARRMVSYIGCEDCCGAIWQWLDEQSFKSDYVTGWDWYNLPGAKGSLYNQDGATGRADVKLLAGGRWDDGSACGSRCRRAAHYRWSAYSDIAARAVVGGC